MPLPDEFLDNFSDELRDNPVFEKYNSPDDLIKGFNEAQAFLGRSIRVPSEEAGEADRAEFYEKLRKHAPDLIPKPNFEEAEQADPFWKSLGKPEEAGQYKIPDGVDFPEEVAQKMQKFAFDSNMTDAQFATLVNSMHADHQATTQAQLDAHKTAMRELKDEWGMALDERTAAAKRINDEYYPGRDFDQLTAAERKGLYEIHVSMTGKGAPAAQQGEQPGAMTPTEVRERAEEMQRKARDPDENLSQPERLRLMTKSIELLKEFDPRYAEAS